VRNSGSPSDTFKHKRAEHYNEFKVREALKKGLLKDELEDEVDEEEGSSKSVDNTGR
jgi:hypothetical protein